MKIGHIAFIIAVVAIGLVLAGYVLTSTDGNESSSGSLNWSTDINSALNTAKETNKPVLVDVYASWCSYCKQMDENTFQNSQVQQKLLNYVLVKVNGDENPDFVKKYQIYGYPTILIMDSSGNLVKKIYGYQSPEDFINMI